MIDSYKLSLQGGPNRLVISLYTHLLLIVLELSEVYSCILLVLL